ncbi:GAP family protein [Pseudarthrobacter sp. So.54]
MIVGAFLVGYAGFLFWHRSQTDNALLGKMKSKFRTARPWEFVVLGVGLNLRPKAIVLAVTAGALISVRDLPLLEGTLFVLAFAAVTQSAVVVPIAVWLHSPGRAEAPLTAIYTLLERHGRTITAAATLIIGLFILGSTIAGL